jgi:hypothetical protein
MHLALYLVLHWEYTATHLCTGIAFHPEHSRQPDRRCPIPRNLPTPLASYAYASEELAEAAAKKLKPADRIFRPSARAGHPAATAGARTSWNPHPHWQQQRRRQPFFPRASRPFGRRGQNVCDPPTFPRENFHRAHPGPAVRRGKKRRPGAQRSEWLQAHAPI